MRNLNNNPNISSKSDISRNIKYLFGYAGLIFSLTMQAKSFVFLFAWSNKNKNKFLSIFIPKTHNLQGSGKKLTLLKP